MKILWLTWKDNEHPLAGGAEVVNEELAKRLVADGHEVLFITGGFRGGKKEYMHPDGYKIIRVGNRVSVYWRTYRYYKKHLQGWADLVIDEVNTMPYFAKYYVKEPNIIFAHMLCREIWFDQLPLPLSLIGYIAEPIYLKLLKDRQVVTVSESSRQDLINVGRFKPENIRIISEGISIPHIAELAEDTVVLKRPKLLSLGSMRPMKRTLDQVKAFEIAKASIPDLELVIAGDSNSKYGKKVLAAIEASKYKDDITYHGRVSQAEKLELMREADAILVTSTKEGWGLTVSEAASQGTPAVVYDVDGLRDSVRNDTTGLVADQNSPEGLAEKIIAILSSRNSYLTLRRNAWSWSKSLTFNHSYKDFKEVLQI